MDRPKTPSGAVARLLLNAAADCPVTNNRALLDCALEFANEAAATGEQPDITERRNELRGCLGEYQLQPERLFERLKSDLGECLDEIRIVPSWWVGELEGRFTVRRFDEVVPTSWRALLAYMVALLFDDAEGLGTDLCRCRLESCAKFFLTEKPKTGQPRRRYHDKECMKAAHAERAPLRKLKSLASRAGVDVERWQEMTPAERAAAKRRPKQRRRAHK